jgi:hypothetical protein
MRPPFIRRAARALARHGAHMLPAEHADWGRAMQSEIDHIGDDAAALRWAFGCLWAGYCVRSADMSKAFIRAARWALAGVIALYALAQLPVLLMVIGYKTGDAGLAASMDGATAGDNYERFTALMDQMTPLQVSAAALHIALYLAAASALALGWRRVPLLLAGALALEVTGKLAMQNLPARAEIFTPRELTMDIAQLGVIAVVGAAAFWLMSRQARAR